MIAPRHVARINIERVCVVHRLAVILLVIAGISTPLVTSAQQTKETASGAAKNVPKTYVPGLEQFMVVHPSVPAKSVKEFIDLAKKEPGKLNYASSGPGTPYHMAGELFKAMSQTDIVHVPHKASGDARNSAVSGTVQMMFDAVTTMTALAKGGQVRALATTGLKRSELTPDLPTVAETVPGYEATIWIGIMAPKGTPKEVVTFLNSHINKVINKPEVREVWLKQGAVPLVKTPEEFDAYLRKDIEKWANVVKVSGAKIQ